MSARTSVLVIESHPLMREALCAAIANEPGFTLAAQLASTEEAVPTAVTLQPDMILIALGNPGRDDLHTLSVLRQALPAVPILALTTNEVLNQEQAALELGASRVLTKAASRSELIHTLHTLRTSTTPACPSET
jgi:DNA-binding NarL/FixJ family response regulator